MRLVVAITGATGMLYAQRLLDHVDPHQHEVHLVLSRYAPQVIAEELPGGLLVPEGVVTHNLKSMKRALRERFRTHSTRWSSFRVLWEPSAASPMA